MIRAFCKSAGVLGLVWLVAGCAAPEAGQLAYDPLEPLNRSVHEANIALDRVALRPASQLYGQAVPGGVRQSVNNFADNLSMPKNIANNILQFRIGEGLQNLARFVMNSTFGVAGLFDPATALGIEAKPTDFGETLHVWGATEGAYLELPVLGPSTARDTAGLVVDFLLDPVNQLLPRRELAVVRASRAAGTLDDRYRFTTSVDGILYDSADSYAQARLIYLENRRFELGGDQAGEDELYDLYAEAFE